MKQMYCDGRKYMVCRDGSRIFLGEGVPLRNGVTNTNKPHFFAEY